MLRTLLRITRPGARTIPYGFHADSVDLVELKFNVSSMAAAFFEMAMTCVSVTNQRSFSTSTCGVVVVAFILAGDCAVRASSMSSRHADLGIQPEGFPFSPRFDFTGLTFMSCS
jgi:hypothetical protein